VAGTPSAGTLSLSLKDALELGLRNNLGLLTGSEATRFAQGARLRALSDLLPNINGRISQSEQQINLAAFGIPRPAGTPEVVGPFSLSDARAYFSAPILDLQAINNHRASWQDVKAAQLSYQDAREFVVLAVANLYLLAVAQSARVDAAQAQLQTAQVLYQQAVHQKNAGVVAGIDVLRAHLQLQNRQQRLVAAKNDFEKQKLDLARAIGLSSAQQFTLVDAMPYAAAPLIDLQQALQHAHQQRRDIQRAEALVKAAEAAKRAAISEALPTLRANGDYGAIGRSFESARSTFSATVALRIPIFQGGKVRGDVLQSDALLEHRKAELQNLRAEVDAEVRKSYLDLQSAGEQIEVTREGLELAKETLTQAKDRYAAGVADNIEVVQAQEALAAANEGYISGVYAHNIAKASLARAVGVAEKSVREFLGANK
jgi:outer membrane protein TolC